MLRSLTAGVVLAFAGSRANIARTILSCTGIVVGVGALVMVVTASDFGQRYAVTTSEVQGGLPATLQVEVSGEVTDRAALEADLLRVGGREVSLYQTPTSHPLLRTGQNVVTDMSVNGVDPDLSGIRRLDLARGRWFTDADTASLAPVLVVNESLAERLGDLTRVQIGTERWRDARIVGVLSDSSQDYSANSAYLLRSPASEDLIFGGAEAAAGPPVDGLPPGAGFGDPMARSTYLVLFDSEHPAAADPFGQEFRTALGSVAWRWGADVPAEGISAFRVDHAEAMREPLRYMSWGLMGIAAVTLGTGLLGVLNVGLVTVRERRRELATYRALGASRTTLFVAVVMEAVVVSVVAGLIAVGGSLALTELGALLVERFLPIPDSVGLYVPGGAVLVGLGSAALVGLLAGIIPAARALRASVVAGLRD
ncbi:ABC transporter permease [Nocardiopsis sp. CNT312]|uniref:ABC transporter permease n=1 Tax=Nocardiopsis sp. CNT312 TaxID=1137268 RepID=UPI000491914C|nr:ABC transporter permease [Nocardiopsis sp. CNT312]